MDVLNFDSLRIGVATSAYQIEGAYDTDGRGWSIWDAFTRQPGAVRNGDTGDVACDHYQRMDQDLDLLAWLGVDTYRFSISWPRIQPDGSGPFNPAGLSFYDRLVDGLLERGITPFVTLYHWDLPLELQKAHGGWSDRQTAQRFASYAERVAQTLGDRVPCWATLNEPWCSAFLGYKTGKHAPGLTDDNTAVRAAHHLLLAHGLAAQALRQYSTEEVGIVLNPTPVWPATEDPADVEAARLVDGVRNRLWLDAVRHEAYPVDVLAAFERVADLSCIQDGDLAVIAEPLDFIGVNYYHPEWAAMSGPGGTPVGPGLTGVVQPDGEGERTAMGWEIRPDGLTELLVRIDRDYGPVPMWITENGAAFDDTLDERGAVDDDRRVQYLRSHLEAAVEATKKGVDLRGYLVWSFLDNFEWSEGYSCRFGLVHVDYATQARAAKSSALWLRDVLRERGAPAR